MIILKIKTLIKFISCIGLFLFSTFLCKAHQKKYIIPAKLLTSFPFKQYNGGVIMVHARLGNLKGSFNFILDSGCGGISLDSTTCAESNLVPVPTDTTIRGMGSFTKVSFLFNQTLHFPNLAIDSLNFHISNYNVLTSTYGEKIDGIIGYSFFSRYILRINFDSSVIEVYSPGKIKNKRGGIFLHPLFFTTIPIQPLTIKDNKKINFNFYFDTGAGLNFLMSQAFANDSNILVKNKKQFDIQGVGTGGKFGMRLTVVKLLKLGKYKFHNVPTYIYKDSLNVTSYPFTGGLLGSDLLRRFNITINYPNKEIYLLPNSQFNNPFDYAYTGLSFYVSEGKILVDEITPKSPGDLAGINQDDELICVDSDCSHDINQYKTLLQSSKHKIKLIIRRDNMLKDVIITPISIL